MHILPRRVAGASFDIFWSTFSVNNNSNSLPQCKEKKDLLNRDLPGIVKDSDTKVLYLLNLTVVGKTFQA